MKKAYTSKNIIQQVYGKVILLAFFSHILFTIIFAMQEIMPLIPDLLLNTRDLLPLFLGLYEWILPNFQSLTQDQTLDVLCYILVVSVGQSLLFSRNASTGGIEIIGKLLNKYAHMELGKALAASGMVVAISSALCYDTKSVVLAVLGTYFGGVVLDNFIFGMNIKRKVCILSSKSDEIVEYILHELHSGASLYDAVGAYDRTTRREINVIVDRQEYRALMDYLRKVDPKAFITVYSVNEINYIPKK